MQVVALLAQKGGAGKTSLALALAVEAGGAGKTVIVLDADPQASACRWRDRRQVPEPAVIDVQPSRLQYALEAAAEQGVDLVVIDRYATAVGIGRVGSSPRCQSRRYPVPSSDSRSGDRPSHPAVARLGR